MIHKKIFIIHKKWVNLVLKFLCYMKDHIKIVSSVIDFLVSNFQNDWAW